MLFWRIIMQYRKILVVVLSIVFSGGLLANQDSVPTNNKTEKKYSKLAKGAGIGALVMGGIIGFVSVQNFKQLSNESCSNKVCGHIRTSTETNLKKQAVGTGILSLLSFVAGYFSLRWAFNTETTEVSIRPEGIRIEAL